MSDPATLGIATKVQKDGYASFEGFQPGLPTEKLLGVIGDALALGSGGPVHELRPHTSGGAPVNTYSGNYGLGEFPLHTDLAHWYLPPRYFLLRCVVGFEDVPTIVLDGAPLVAEIGAVTLTRALMRPRRPINGKSTLLRLYQQVGATSALLRWDEKYIQPSTEAGANGALSFSKLLAAATRTQLLLCRAGDTLVVDNWRILHGRAPVPEHCQGRIIERVYLRSLH